MHLFEMLINWILGIIIDCCSELINEMAEVIINTFLPTGVLKYGVDRKIGSFFGMTLFESAYSVIFSLAFALLVIKFLFNVFSDLKPGMSQREGLFQHFARFILALCLTGMSYWIIQMLASMGYDMIGKMIALKTEPGSVEYGTSLAELAEDCTSARFASDTLIIPCIIMLAITWNFMKLFVEMAERLFVTTTTTMLAPLGFCTFVSQDWEQIMKRYLQLVFSTYFVTALNVFFIRVALQGLEHLQELSDKTTDSLFDPSLSGDHLLWQMIAILAVLILAQRADKLVADSGLSVSQTGGNLLGEIVMAGRLATSMGRTAGRVGDRAVSAGKWAAGKAGVGAAVVGKKLRGKSADNLFSKSVGKEGSSQLKASGNWNTKNGNKEVCHLKGERKKDGSLVTSGTLQAKNGKCFSMRTLPKGAAEAKKGEGIVRTKDGTCIAVSDAGARCAMTPNGAQTMPVKRINAVNAESTLNNSLTDIKAAGMYSSSNKQQLESVAQKAREALYGPNANPVDVNNSVSAAKELLGPAATGQTVVGAWHDENEAAGVFHAMTVDNATGNINTFDIASSDNASRISGLSDRECNSSHKTDVGDMQVYKTQLRTSDSVPDKHKFTDANGHYFEPSPDERIRPTEYAGVYKVDKVVHRVAKNEQGNIESEWDEYYPTAYLVPDGRYTAQGKTTHLGIDGQNYSRVQIGKDNKMEENAFLSAARNFFTWKK